MLNNHLDGMSSDDEVPDHETTLYKNQISTIYIISEFYSISKFNDEKMTKNPKIFQSKSVLKRH